MPVRRSSDPITTQRVWDAVRYASASHLSCTLPVIVKYLQKVENCSTNQAELYVQQCLQDGLLVILQKLGNKGTKTSTTSEIYKIPIDEFKNPHGEDKDWYCIECHLAGDVNLCKSCHRVFHSECAIASKKKFYDFQNVSKTCINYNIKATLENRLNLLKTSTSTLSNSNITDYLEDSTKETKEESIPDVDAKNSDLSSSCSLAGIFDSFEKLENENLDNLENLVENAIENKENNDIKTETITTDEVKENKDEKNEESVDNISNDQENIKNEEKNDGYDENLCRICNLIAANDDTHLEKEELNYLLLFVHKRIKSWIPSCITTKMAPNEQPEWFDDNEVKWRISQLFFEDLSMNTIEKKILEQKYSRISEFLADVITVQHNVAVYHGIESQEYGAAELMYEDCNYDLSELRNCVDCYKHSNEKINSNWFSLPCRLPHKLVWAKQKGYPYWPAKVIKEANGKFDVRFFGGNHERSLLQKKFIKPITFPMSNLQIMRKKTPTYNKAMQELELHQKLIENPSEVQKILSENNHVDKKSKERRSSQNVQKIPKKNQKKPSAPVNDLGPFTFDEMCDDFESSFAKRNQKRKLSQSPNTDSAKFKKKNLGTNSTEVRRNSSSKSIQGGSNDVINLSSDVDDETIFKEVDQFSPGYNEVSSSTEHVKLMAAEDGAPKEAGDGIMQQLDRQYSEAVERVKQKLEKCKDKKQLIKVALDSMQIEIDRINNEHDDYLKKMFEAHNQEISQTKKRQWCYNCEQDAIYHCCWNTAYCSPICQQQHWQAEHKKVCRRKR